MEEKNVQLAQQKSDIAIELTLRSRNIKLLEDRLELKDYKIKLLQQAKEDAMNLNSAFDQQKNSSTTPKKLEELQQEVKTLRWRNECDLANAKKSLAEIQAENEKLKAKVEDLERVARINEEEREKVGQLNAKIGDLEEQIDIKTEDAAQASKNSDSTDKICLLEHDLDMQLENVSVLEEELRNNSYRKRYLDDDNKYIRSRLRRMAKMLHAVKRKLSVQNTKVAAFKRKSTGTS